MSQTIEETLVAKRESKKKSLVVYLTGGLDEHFEATMADPPYNEEFAKKLYNCNYPQWSKWTREMVRITKVGGRVGIMQNYVVPCPKNCEYEHIYVIIGRIKQFAKIITVFRRVI